MRSVKTLVVIADDTRARFLENRGVGKGLAELQEIHAKDFSDTEVSYADRPGREQAGPGRAGHVLDRTTSVERQEREAFARHVLGHLGKLMKKGSNDRLAIAAAPEMLGRLRDDLPDDLRRKLVFDLPKNLIRTPPAKLVDHFADKIVF